MKLYVLVRKDLSKSQQAVQSSHAVAEWLLRGTPTTWDNGTLVLLGVKNECDLHKWMDKLQKRNREFVKFIEPDIGDQVTSIASVSTGEEFKGLELLRL